MSWLDLPTIYSPVGGGVLTILAPYGGTISSNYPTGSFIQKGKTITLSYTALEHFAFNTVTINGTVHTEQVTTVVMENEDITIVPSWKELGGNVIVAQSTGGTLSASKTGFVREGTNITVTYTPSTGYYLNTLNVILPSGNKDIKSSLQFTVENGDSIVGGTWEKNRYNVGVTQVAGGTIYASQTGSLPWGTSITVSASANSGYKLNSLNWNGNAIANGGSFATPQANVNITGSFSVDSIIANNCNFTVKTGTFGWLEAYETAYSSNFDYSDLNAIRISESDKGKDFIDWNYVFLVDIPKSRFKKYSSIRMTRNDGFSLTFPYSTESEAVWEYAIYGTYHRFLQKGTQYITIVGIP